MNPEQRRVLAWGVVVAAILVSGMGLIVALGTLVRRAIMAAK